jgi:hypothetical protein
MILLNNLYDVLNEFTDEILLHKNVTLYALRSLICIIDIAFDYISI